MKKLFTLFAALGAMHANAQLDSCNAFLQGNYVEVGISPVGSFGSSVSQPSGYHGNSNGTSGYSPCSTSGPSGGYHLGFIADPAMDGWATGTPPFFGDYFLPGSPFEGWELQIGAGTRVQAFNTNDSAFSFSTPVVTSGSNISYSATGSTVTSTWQGMVDSVGVTQVTTLDTGGLYFTMQVTLTNYSSTPINDIYYFRSLDPDNEEIQTSNFSTNNLILHQTPDTTVVTATGQMYSTDVLSLGTTDTNARCLIYEAWPLSVSQDLSELYNETYGTAAPSSADYAEGTSDNGDLAIGLVYHIAHLASVDSAADSVARTTSVYGRHPANTSTFKFFYAFGTNGLDSAVTAMNHVTTSSLAIKNINQTADIKVYPNPASNMINVAGLNTGDQLSLTDMMGRSTALNGNISGNGKDQFSISSFPAGNYILVVKDAEGNTRSRVSVQKQ